MEPSRNHRPGAQIKTVPSLLRIQPRTNTRTSATKILTEDHILGARIPFLRHTSLSIKETGPRKFQGDIHLETAIHSSRTDADTISFADPHGGAKTKNKLLAIRKLSPIRVRDWVSKG